MMYNIEWLKEQSIEDIFKLEDVIYYKGNKWDYESDCMEDEEYEDEYLDIIRLEWCIDGEIYCETIYNYTDEDIIRKGDFVIFSDITGEIYIFDDMMLCDGVVEGYFDFNSYELINGDLIRTGTFIK